MIKTCRRKARIRTQRDKRLEGTTKASSTIKLTLVAALVASVVAPGTAAAEDPAFVPWSELAPGLTTEYDPSSSNLCNRGDTRCVDAVITEMRRRFNPLAKSCNHNAVFALTYLRTTEEYRRTINDPTFFKDTPFVNHEDAVFASYYFQAYDNWYKKAQRGRVAPAWKIAFTAADNHGVSGTGSLLLGMSAHINRDLPFVLAAIGLVDPQGDSRKGDHDKVNKFLNRVTESVIEETSRRFDPRISDASIKATTADETGLFQLVAGWRERAWRNAERLVAARTSQERQLVADSIEQAALLDARYLEAETAYHPPLTSSSARDAYCAVHWND